MALDVMNELAIDKLQRLVTSQAPCKADAIVWLQGNEYDRGEKVMELFDAGYAPRIIVTGNNVNKVDIGSVTVEDIREWLISHEVDTGSIVIDDQAMNTRDQGMNVAKIAKQLGLQSLILVASTHHQMRAFLTLLRQSELVGWNGTIINQPREYDQTHVPSGRSVTVKEAFEEEKNKINIYFGDVASVERGLRYIKNQT
jgi:uncharacterized SAM-binding protein YcdF (DUF218 family)